MLGNKPFIPGSRVAVDGLSRGQSTVIGWPSGLLDNYPEEYDAGYISLCADLSTVRDSDYFAPVDQWAGDGHGRLVSTKRLTFMSQANYHKIPEHIGVCIPYEAPIHKEVTDGPASGKVMQLPGGLTGRVLRYRSSSPGLVHPQGQKQYEVAWHAGLMGRFDIHTGDYPGIFHDAPATIRRSPHNYVTWEDIEALLWCRRRAGGDPTELWPELCGLFDGSTDFNDGDFVLYEGGRPVPYATGEGIRYTIMPGDIVQIIGKDTRRKAANVALPPWAGERYHSGCSFTVNLGSLRPLRHQLIQSGTEVTVVANIDFGGESLEGKQGLVVIPTDVEGDIGIEFVDSVRGAGSLDGRGENGRCLYLPASAVKAEGAE